MSAILEKMGAALFLTVVGFITLYFLMTLYVYHVQLHILRRKNRIAMHNMISNMDIENDLERSQSE